MEGLSTLLGRIGELEKDLTAEYISQHESGHEEADSGKSYDDGRIWVVDQEQIMSPDTEKRGKARVELKQICDSSNWFTARYYAARALGKNSEELTELMSSWIPILEKLIIREPETSLQIIEDIRELLSRSRSNESNELQHALKQLWEKSDQTSARRRAALALGYPRFVTWLIEITRKK